MLAATSPLATQLIRADAAFRAAVRGWDDRQALPPDAVDAMAREQMIELRLARDGRSYRVVIRDLPTRLRRNVVDDVVAHRELSAIAPSRPGPPIRLGAALSLARLVADDREAERRSGIPWSVLAAINFVETDFGRLREASASGALGPMQFMPRTWAAYGRGSLRDPHAAILAAARFLRAAGGLHDLRAAVLRYNPSRAYVDAVFRFAGQIRRDPLGVVALYARRVIVRSGGRYRRLNARS